MIVDSFVGVEDWAIATVDANGTLAFGRGVVSVVKAGTGIYDITLERPLPELACSISVLSRGATPALTAVYSVAHVSDTVKVIHAFSVDSSGGGLVQDTAFHINIRRVAG